MLEIEKEKKTKTTHSNRDAEWLWAADEPTLHSWETLCGHQDRLPEITQTEIQKKGDWKIEQNTQELWDNNKHLGDCNPRRIKREQSRRNIF